MEAMILIAQTALWSIACWLCYRSGKATGHQIGYTLAMSRSKDLHEIKLAAARTAGRHEAWKEIHERISAVQTVTANTHDPQVH